MLKRRRRLDRPLGKKVSVILCLLFLCMGFCGCARFAVVGQVESYFDFLHGYEKYAPKEPSQPTDPIFDTLPSIEGFAPLISFEFTRGLPFDGKVTYAERNGKSYALGKDGTLSEVASIPNDAEIVCGMYAYTEGEFCGVRSVYGDDILPPRYDSVQIIGETILTMRDKVAETHRKGEVLGRVDEGTISVRLLNDSYLLWNDRICDVRFAPCYFETFPYWDVPHEDVVAIAYPDGLAGFANLHTGTRIGGTYASVTPFCEGTATAMTSDGYAVVIDSEGNEVYRKKNCRIGAKRGGYYCFLLNGFYGVMNERFEVMTEPQFLTVKYEQACGKYLIVPYKDGECLYDLERRSYSDTLLFEHIEYADGLFFCTTDGKTAVLNTQLQVLTVCDKAVWQDGVLMVVADDVYAYYIRSKK